MVQQRYDGVRAILITNVISSVLPHARQLNLALARGVVTIAVARVILNQTLSSFKQLLFAHALRMRSNSNLQSKLLEAHALFDAFTAQHSLKAGQTCWQINLLLADCFLLAYLNSAFIKQRHQASSYFTTCRIPRFAGASSRANCAVQRFTVFRLDNGFKLFKCDLDFVHAVLTAHVRLTKHAPTTSGVHYKV